MSPLRPLRWLFRPLSLLIVFVLLTSCTSQLPPVAPPTSPVEPQVTAIPVPFGTPVPATAEQGILALPASFRYEVTLRPAQPDALPTTITGMYGGGAWSQSSHTGSPEGEAIREELVVARDPSTGLLHSYTRAASDATWTRWPGVTFDLAYGLASPFTVLRLRPLATQTAAPQELAPDRNAPSGATLIQALFSAAAVKQVLMEGVAVVAQDAESRAALEQQISAQFLPQTINYWIDGEGRVVQAAATLLALGQDGQPAPWVELAAHFYDYGDPAIAINPPVNAVESMNVAVQPESAQEALAASEVAPGVNLRVRVFAGAGVPAADSVVTVYRAGLLTIVAEKLGPDAQFTLKPGQYDVLVRTGSAQQWLKDVAVTADALSSNDVQFEFTPLIVTVTLNGALPPVDVVAFLPGETSNFAALASENPARLLLPPGEYDVEAGTQDGAVRKRVAGVQVATGQETTLTIDLGQP